MKILKLKDVNQTRINLELIIRYRAVNQKTIHSGCHEPMALMIETVGGEIGIKYTDHEMLNEDQLRILQAIDSAEVPEQNMLLS